MTDFQILKGLVDIVELFDNMGRSYLAGIYTGLTQDDLAILNAAKERLRELEDA